MAIETFQQREKAEYIYSTYFSPDSEHQIDFDLLDTLEFYGAISEKQQKKLTKRLREAGDNLFKEIEKFDKQQLKNKK